MVAEAAQLRSQLRDSQMQNESLESQLMHAQATSVSAFKGVEESKIGKDNMALVSLIIALNYNR